MPTIIRARWQLWPSTADIRGLGVHHQAFSRATTYARNSSPPAHSEAAAAAVWVVCASRRDSPALSTPRQGTLPTGVAVPPRLVIPPLPTQPEQNNHVAGRWSRERRFWTKIRAQESILTKWRAQTRIVTPTRRYGIDSQKYCRDENLQTSPPRGTGGRWERCEAYVHC